MTSRGSDAKQRRSPRKAFCPGPRAPGGRWTGDRGRRHGPESREVVEHNGAQAEVQPRTGTKDCLTGATHTGGSKFQQDKGTINGLAGKIKCDHGDHLLSGDKAIEVIIHGANDLGPVYRAVSVVVMRDADGQVGLNIDLALSIFRCAGSDVYRDLADGVGCNVKGVHGATA